MTRKKVGDPFPDGKGYVDEVGGRESGKPSGQSRVEESGGVPAAANPAAHVHRIMNYEEPPYPEDCLPCAEREERICVLEARLKEVKGILRRFVRTGGSHEARPDARKFLEASR